METLELLEELLINFTGTVLLVSHDRIFLDHVVTSTLVFSENGQIQEYVGGYQNYLEQKSESVSTSIGNTVNKIKNMTVTQKENNKKLTFKEKKELTELPKEIERLEQDLKKRQTETQDLNFYKQDEAKIKLKLNELNQIEEIIDQKYQRWNHLEMLD